MSRIMAQMSSAGSGGGGGGVADGQVVGPLLLGVGVMVWLVGGALVYKWRQRVRRRERAARLRNRVQLHAFAIDVLKRRPAQPGDPQLAPADRQQLLEHLRLLDAWFAS